MSQGSVEVVRNTFAALLRADHESAAAGFHPDVVWNNTAVFPDQRTLVGTAAIFDFWETLTQTWEEMRSSTEIERIAESTDRVVVGVHSFGAGRSSGIPFDAHYAMVFHVSRGRISRVDVHGRWAKALDAVGLSE
jgi:ketosteroid isomerase-like protein